MCFREFSISWLKLLGYVIYLHVILASIISIIKFFCNCNSTVIFIVGLIQHSWKTAIHADLCPSKVWCVSQGRLVITERKPSADPVQIEIQDGSIKN